MKTNWKTPLAALAFVFAWGVPCAAQEFVLRPEFPMVPTLSTAELRKIYEQTIVVDVRSEFEFEVAHVSKAVHIPVALATFVDELRKLRDPNDLRPIAFYCNGYACAKSYKATMAAMEAGFVNVFVYDAGMHEWVTEYPDKTTLMGHTPAPTDKLISEKEFTSRKIAYPEFVRLAALPGTVVIDIREPFQRSLNPDLPQNQLLPLDNVRNIPTDRLLGLLQSRRYRGEKLLITDAVGEQVRWLQYPLEECGYSDYWFLDDGVLGAAKAGAFPR